MARFARFEVYENSGKVIRRFAVIEVRRYLKKASSGHITVTLHSGWPGDYPVMQARFSNKDLVKKLVNSFLENGVAP